MIKKVPVGNTASINYRPAYLKISLSSENNSGQLVEFRKFSVTDPSIINKREDRSFFI